MTHRTLRRTLRVALVVAGVVIVAGCSSDDAPEDTDNDTCIRGCTDVGDSDVLLTTCEADDDCAASERCDVDSERCVVRCSADADCGPVGLCDTSTGVCGTRPPCDTAADCGAGESCDSCAGVCIDEVAGTVCVSDANCGFDEFCDSCVGVCQARLALCDPCAADSECGESADRCLDFAVGGSFCGEACNAAGGGCSVGYECEPSANQCVPVSRSCEAVAQCDDDVDCAGTQICSATRICIEGCVSDDLCATGDVCSAGRCQPSCVSDADCGDLECDPTGRCIRPGGCFTSASCTEPETYCDREVGTCVDGCQVDTDCLTSGQVCEAGSCVVRGCRGNFTCSFGLVCDFDSGNCVEPEGPFCDDCNGDDVDSCGTTNVCASLQDADGNDQGAFCFVACTDDADNLCPQGYACRELDIDGDMRRVCTRSCYEGPV